MHICADDSSLHLLLLFATGCVLSKGCPDRSAVSTQVDGCSKLAAEQYLGTGPFYLYVGTNCSAGDCPGRPSLELALAYCKCALLQSGWRNDSDVWSDVLMGVSTAGHSARL